jgi:hypothetical protein
MQTTTVVRVRAHAAAGCNQDVCELEDMCSRGLRIPLLAIPGALLVAALLNRGIRKSVHAYAIHARKETSFDVL